MRLLLALVLLLALTTTFVHSASSITNRHSRTGPRTHWYTRNQTPQGWTQLDAASDDEQLTFTLVVKGSNAAELERRFWAVSDPTSSEYGHFMTNAEIEALVAPSPAELRQLYSTLTAHKITMEQVTSHGDSFDVTCTVAQASALFATRFFHFRHTTTGHDTIRQWGDYSLPAALAKQTELVLGVHTFPTIEQRQQMRATRNARNAATTAAAANADITPAWIPRAVSAVYGVPYPIAPLAYSEISAGVIEWVEETFSEKDLQRFAKQVNQTVRNPTDYHIVGNNTVAGPGIEASLDIQWIEGVNPGSTPWFWIVDNNAWMYTFTVQFLVATDYPQIISLSYGLPEVSQCEDFSPSDCNGVSYQQYIRIVDKQFMKIGMLGVSVIVCSQDRGTYVPMGVAAAGPFLPEYPGTSKYITSVGATEMGNPQFNLKNPPPACSAGQWECITGGREQAVSYNISFYLSGGGFSNVDERPSYQSAAVEAYLNSGVSLPSAILWNRTGRGFPDVSAIGYNGYIVDDGEETLVSGTSMSTPIFAAVIALVAHDYYRITNSTLGFLNPLLYQAQAAGAGLFTDITVGDNCATGGCPSPQDGFKVTKGWDPVTGLGSPVYPAMKKYITALAESVVARRQAQ